MKVLDYQNNGMRLVCIRHFDNSVNPYKLYSLSWDSGWHRKKLVEYADMKSVFFYISTMIDCYY